MSAGDWIKMRNNLPDDPRVLRIAAATQIDDVDLIIGKLFACGVTQMSTQPTERSRTRTPER